MPTNTTSRISAEAFTRVLREGMPSGAAMPFEVVSLERGLAVLSLATGAADLRPGATVAGPVLFGFADLAMYAAVMSALGEVPLAVTTDATIHFLRRPPAGVLIARARLLKEGQRLVVGDVTIAAEGREDQPVAHVVMTYSVPPSGSSSSSSLLAARLTRSPTT
jgi:acyl-coenzyme A thioesterase PaaI-like protein